MKTLRHVSLVYLLILWSVSHGNGEDKMATSLCDIILTTVRTEASPPVLHELCYDNNSVTFAVKCDKIWYERILDFCSTIGPHVWNISMDRLSISSPLTLELVKSSQVVDSCSLNLTTEHLVHETISIMGAHKTRFLLTIEKDCSAFLNNRAIEPDQYFPEMSAKQFSLNQSTTPDNTQQLSENHQEKGPVSTTTENLRDKGLMMNSNTSEDVVTTLQPVQTTHNIHTSSTNTLKCNEGNERCSKLVDPNVGNKQLSSDYLSQSFIKEYSDDAVNDSFRYNKTSFSSSNYVVYRYNYSNTLTISSTVHLEILPDRVTDNYMLNSDVPNSHLDLSSILSEQKNTEIFSKHDDEKTKNQRHRQKRDDDNKLDKLGPFSSSLQSSSYPDKYYNLPSEVMNARNIVESLETIKQGTFSSHVTFDHNDGGNILHSLVNVETSDSELSVDSNNTISSGAQTLQVSATDISLFPTLYSSYTNFDVYTVSADLSDSVISEYTFQEDGEIQSTSINRNSVRSYLYNSPVVMEAESSDNKLDTAVLAPSETVWTHVSASGLTTSLLLDNQDNQASKVESTHFHLIPSHSVSMAEKYVTSFLVSSTQESELTTTYREGNYLTESIVYKQEPPTILSVSSSSSLPELESEFRYVTSAPELFIQNTNPFVTLTLINSSPDFVSQETKIDFSPDFTLPVSRETIDSASDFMLTIGQETKTDSSPDFTLPVSPESNIDSASDFTLTIGQKTNTDSSPDFTLTIGQKTNTDSSSDFTLTIGQKTNTDSSPDFTWPISRESNIDLSPDFPVPIGRETTIYYSDPQFIESTVSQFLASGSVYISDLSSSSEYETSSWTHQIPLKSTTSLFKEQTTDVNEQLTSTFKNVMTTPLIQFTKSSSWNLNFEIGSLEYSNVDHHIASSLTGISLTKQGLETKPSIEYTDISSLASSSLFPSSFSTDSHSITSPATRQSFADASLTSNGSSLVTSQFAQIRVTPSAVTEPNQTWPPTSVPTPFHFSSTMVTPQARQDHTTGLDDDTMWPIVAAMVIGIPVVIVLGIAITVIHRNRRQDPRKFFAMRTLNSSSMSSIATPRQDISRESSVDV